jgi:hypothetical protein
MLNNRYLIDHGANAGVSGEYMRVLFRTRRTVDIKVIDNHHVNDIGIGTVNGVIQNTARYCCCHLFRRSKANNASKRSQWY